MSGRFFVSQLQSAMVELTGPEAHHLRHVLRMRVGQTVTLFDGRGTEATAEITWISKRAIELRILEKRTAAEPAQTGLVLGTAVPKGDRFRWLVEKATELGVDRLVPLQTARSVVNPRDSKLDKLRQTVISASKQCGRNRLMEIEDPAPWSDFVSREFPNRVAYVAHPPIEGLSAKDSLLQIIDHAPVNSHRDIVVSVGPEGGFEDDEIQLALQAGAKLVNLGKTILRTETAAIALAALFGLGRLR